MEYGFYVPHRGPLATPGDIVAIARHGERLGFTHALIADHIVVPREIASPYPYSQTGAFAEVTSEDGRRIVIPPGSDHGECLEQFAVMAYLAAATTEIRLLTAVMVVPHRNPVVAAKALATIDVLSKGRVTVGCGAGWLREEFEALGLPPFDERGRVSDDYIAVFKELWTNAEPVFDGAYARFSNISALPQPVQSPHPPIWIGGESKAAMRRAARLGDAWCPIGANPRHPLDTAKRFRAGVEQLARIGEEIGRAPDSIDLAYVAPWYDETREHLNGDGARQLLTGSPAAVQDDIAALRACGVGAVCVGLGADSLANTLDRMDRFAVEIMQPSSGVES